MPNGEFPTSNGIKKEEELILSPPSIYDPSWIRQQLYAGIMRHSSDLRSTSFLLSGLVEWQDQMLDQNSLILSKGSRLEMKAWRDPQFSLRLTIGPLTKTRLPL